MTNTYNLIQTPKLACLFTDPENSDALTDPVCVLLKIWNGTDTIWTYTYGMSLQGAWNASTNTPALADGTGTVGHYYTVSAGGTVDFGNGPITFTTNDAVFYDGVRWQELINLEATAITRASVGSYHLYFRVYDEAFYWYRFEGYNAVTSTGTEKGFRVRDSKFTPPPV